MFRKLIWNDVKGRKLLSFATIFFMAVSALLLALGAMLFADLLGALDSLMARAKVPDFLQMHSGQLDEEILARFTESNTNVEDWQTSSFLNLDAGMIELGGKSLAGSTQDNGLVVQNEHFDYLLDLNNEIPEVRPGEVWVPIAYRDLYELSVGQTMDIGGKKLTIAGFVRDAQMNSMMSSSKRFLVHPSDYENLAPLGEEEYLIEFLLHDGIDTAAFQTAYSEAGLPDNGPAITKALIRMVNALSDGTLILVIFLIAAVVLLISILCIHLILQLQMERARKEVGMLKAIGLSRKDVRRIYYSKFLLFSAAGGILGLAGAFWLNAPLSQQLRDLYGVASTDWQSGLAGIAAVVLAEGLILLTVHSFLRKLDRLTAVAAMRQSVQAKNRRGIVLTGGILAACTFLMVVPQNLLTTLASPNFVGYMGIGGADVRMDIRAGNDSESISTAISEELQEDPAVEAHVQLVTSSVPAVLKDNSRVSLLVEAGAHDIYPVSYLTGGPPEGDFQIALSSLNADELGLAVGNTVDLILDNTEFNYVVSGIYADITNGGRTAKVARLPVAVPAIWSIIYVTLKDKGNAAAWMDNYRAMDVEVADIASYVQSTYAQTLDQLYLASVLAVVISVAIIVVVVLLFVRLQIEQNRRGLSLRKALGFTSSDLMRSEFFKQFLPAAVGTAIGVLLGCLLGEIICGAILQSFGADGFRFEIELGQILVLKPMTALAAAVTAILLGIAAIQKIRPFECCQEEI